MSKIIVTGGCGYIGSHTSIALIDQGHEVVIFDDLSNASEETIVRIFKITGIRPHFSKVDLRDKKAALEAFEQHKDATAIIHFAAESHVDRSITSADQFIKTNINKTIF